MGVATVFYASEINFLTGFAEICLFDDFEGNDTAAAKILWAVRMLLLSVLFGFWAVSGFGLVSVILLIVCVVFYSVSAQLGHQREKKYKDKIAKFRSQNELCYYLASISIINWVFAIPFGGGKGRHRARAVWLVINFLTFAILAGVYFTDTPMKKAWGCYPPSTPWAEIGSSGICPQSPKGSYLTCNTPPVKSSAFLACQHFDWVEGLGMEAVRFAMLLAAVSVGVYLVSIPSNLNR